MYVYIQPMSRSRRILRNLAFNFVKIRCHCRQPKKLTYILDIIYNTPKIHYPPSPQLDKNTLQAVRKILGRMRVYRKLCSFFEYHLVSIIQSCSHVRAICVDESLKHPCVSKLQPVFILKLQRSLSTLTPMNLPIFLNFFNLPPLSFSSRACGSSNFVMSDFFIAQKQGRQKKFNVHMTTIIAKYRLIIIKIKYGLVLITQSKKDKTNTKKQVGLAS